MAESELTGVQQLKTKTFGNKNRGGKRGGVTFRGKAPNTRRVLRRCVSCRCLSSADTSVHLERKCPAFRRTKTAMDRVAVARHEYHIYRWEDASEYPEAIALARDRAVRASLDPDDCECILCGCPNEGTPEMHADRRCLAFHRTDTAIADLQKAENDLSATQAVDFQSAERASADAFHAARPFDCSMGRDLFKREEPSNDFD